ncbi:hypothetical protein, partial [Ruminococcus flavefaciens]|uniref:hypothetical protein n=1 Tax=Ruminococcus flavefaciens TaxID=1265 RepID=UPI0015634194
ADIVMTCTGAQAVGIGVLEDGEGSIYIKNGKIDMKMRSAKHSAIGAMKGSVNTKIRDAVISIDSEGDDVTGIGDSAGTGNVTIIDSQVSLVVNAGNPKDIGTENGDVQIQNSNVSSLVNNKRTTYASN